MHGEQIVPFRLPLWVISGHRSTPTQCPLYPQKRTLVEHIAMSAMCQKQTWARLTQSPHRRWKAISVVCLLAEWQRANQVPMIRIAPQQQLISFVVERLRVPWRSEPAGVARPFIIAIAIDHGATRSQEAAVVEWPSSRNSVAHQRCLRCIECVAMSAVCQKQTFRLLLDIIVGGQGCSSSWSITRETSPSPILASD